MLDAVHRFIPVLTSEAGSCLTNANWEEAGINVVTYYLDSLLIKPGHAVLKKIPDLSSYTGWQGKVILNACRLKANKEGMISLVSPFDGARVKLSLGELFELIAALKPDAIILPAHIIQDFPGIWTNWPESILPFIAAEDLMHHEVPITHGVYCHIKGAHSESDIIKQMNHWPHLFRYISGDVSHEFMRVLKEQGIEYIESDEPAKIGMAGKVYTHDGELNLTDLNRAMQFETIEADCKCPTCTQQFTRAYLHHLFLNTPLLCQRFLIQHNVHFAKSV